MRDLFKSLVIALAVVGLFGGTVLAQDNISNTGPGSDNSINEQNNTDVDIDNDNDIDVDIDCDQDASSGDAEVDGNTTGGGASSGDASNECDVDVDVDVNNGGCQTCNPDEDDDDDDNGSTPTQDPEDDGNVLGAPNLPDTNGTSGATLAGTTALSLGGLAASAKLAVVLVRRFTL